MILLVNPRATRPQHRRFPLSVMALGAALPPHETWEIWDGNRPGDGFAGRLLARIEAAEGTADPVKLVAITAMPGPQLANSIAITKRVKERFPRIPTVWGGYFPSLYPKPAARAPYVDWAVRGQGEVTLVELLEVLDGRRDPATVNGLAYRDGSGDVRLNPERTWVGPDELPPPPYGRIDVSEYLEPTFLGCRSGVYQASIGCPYRCNFCGVIGALGSREKFEEPARTARHLSVLVQKHGMDGLHFYDNNFFLKEPHAVEMAERLAPLKLRWWCESRVDVLLGYSDETLRKIRRAGLAMVFLGAESGSNETLAKMAKGITAEETLEVTRRLRDHGIVPELSFVLGGPDEPEAEIETTLGFVRKLKTLNPECELIFYFYTPTPQRAGTYGGVDPLEGTPQDLDEWADPAWLGWMTHESPDVPWMTPALRAKVLDFELVLKSRFPSIHDARTRRWGKALAERLARRRWERGHFDRPWLLRKVRDLARLPAPDPQLYGHLRPPAEATA